MPRSLDSIERELLSSEKFRSWRWTILLATLANTEAREAPKDPKPFEEDHFSPQELAEKWGVSSETIRQLFKAEPGVLRLPSRKATTGTRSYVSLKIPQSIAARVHKRLTAVPQ